MTKQSNWNKFDKAFNQVSAFLVLDAETRNTVAKISLKYPKDGAGRLTCYMHIIGNELQIGTASGYGYDKRTTAIINAADNYLKNAEGFNVPEASFLNLLNSNMAQSGWQEVINEKNGFTVIQVI